MGARLRCASATMCTMRDSMVSAPIFSRGDHQRARAVDRAADHIVPGRLFNRHRLAGHHRFIDGARSLCHGPINRHGFTGSHPQSIAHLDLVKGHFFVRAIGAKAARCLRRQLEERPNGTAGLLPRTQLKHLAEQDENRHHRRSFIVDRDEAAMLPKARREKARGKSCRQTIQIGRAYP